MKTYVKNERNNYVREDLNNRQKEFCMCWDCHKFKPETEDKGCPIIHSVLQLANSQNIILPVWECNGFSEKK
jgi:cytochrome c2